MSKGSIRLNFNPTIHVCNETMLKMARDEMEERTAKEIEMVIQLRKKIN